jgi:hypothetical protein
MIEQNLLIFRRFWYHNNFETSLQKKEIPEATGFETKQPKKTYKFGCKLQFIRTSVSI